jgi:hypothetical protein
MKAPILLAFLGLATAQAAEPTGTLTLACEGTTTQDTEPDAKQPISMSLYIDFNARTVGGFGSDATFPIGITDITETIITFNGGSKAGGKVYSFQIGGTIDRVTGAVEAVLWDGADGALVMDYELLAEMQANAADVLGNIAG